jgi:hypothetical protein
MTTTCPAQRNGQDGSRHRRAWARYLLRASLAITAGLGLALAAAAVPALARPKAPARYIFRTLNNPNDGSFNQLFGINNHNKIAGYYGSGAHGHPSQGFTLTPPYAAGNYHMESFPGSAQTVVSGLNDTGVTVGFFSKTNKVNSRMNTYVGFYLKNGKYHRVAFPGSASAGGRFDELLAVNNFGKAVGDYTDDLGLSHGYRYNVDTHKFSRINVPGASSVTATGINNGGAIVGYYTNSNGKVVSFLLRPNGQLFTFARAHTDMTQAFGINKAGEVVGALTIGNSTYGFTYHVGGAFRIVTDPNGKGSTVINGVNNDGDLVGFYTDIDGNTNGMLAIP